MKKVYLYLNQAESGFKYAFIAFTMIAVLTSSCKKYDNTLPSDSSQINSVVQQTPASAKSVSPRLSQEDALTLLNSLFKNMISPIKREQVEGVNKQRFVQWLHSSQMEDEYLNTLLSANVSGFILLHNVTLLESGEQATIALASVPAQLQAKYASAVIIINTSLDVDFGLKICKFNLCILGDGFKPICLATQIKRLKTQPCPPSVCSATKPCPGVGLNFPIYETIAAF